MFSTLLGDGVWMFSTVLRKGVWTFSTLIRDGVWLFRISLIAHARRHGTLLFELTS
jgi:hypothetical protein